MAGEPKVDQVTEMMSDLVSHAVRLDSSLDIEITEGGFLPSPLVAALVVTSASSKTGS